MPLSFQKPTVDVSLSLFPSLNPPPSPNTEGKQEEFLKSQNLSKEDIQPPGLGVWSDPFEEKKKKR